MNATNSVVTTTNDEPKKPKGLTRQQWFTLFVIGSVHFASAICVSLQAPFYPQEVIHFTPYSEPVILRERERINSRIIWPTLTKPYVPIC